jgi:SWI/SNF-related matrix-associated actin-dependent regulator 1 of chromatin subfamily A
VTTLLPYQKKGVEWLQSRDFALLADEPGLGKSAQAIRACDAVGADKVLVICPASLRGNWAREFSHFQQRSRSIDAVLGKRPVGADVTIASYDFAARKAEALAGAYDVLILDECFPGSTLVDTERGRVPIGAIVQGTLPLRVWSSSPDGQPELRAVTRYVKTPAPDAFYRISFEGGEVKCTGAHKVYVEGDGFVPAAEIEAGQELRVVHRTVRAGASQDPVLQQTLLCDVAREGTPVPRSSGDARLESRAQKAAAPGCVGEDAPLEFVSGVSRQTGRNIEVAQREILDRAPGRKRLYNGTAEASSGSHGVADGTRRVDGSGEGEVSQSSELLQGGLGVPGAENSGGSGRRFAQNQEMEISGQAEDRRTERARVVSVEVQQRTGLDGAFVYNLEVEGNHNYFAGGVLVANCHYVKNPKSKRTKAVFGKKCDRGIDSIAANCDRVICLSGTPAPNDPSELYPMVRALRPDLLDKRQHSYWGFVQKYCRTRDTGFGLQIVGGKNMGELRERLEPFILRRRKADVLPDLPALRLETLYLDGVLSRELSVLSGELAGQIEAALAADGIEGLAKLAPHVAKLRRLTGTLKVAGVIETVENEVQHDGKIVLFAHHTGVIEALETGLRDAGFGVVVVDGACPAGARQSRVDQFQGDPTVQVFIGQLTAAGTGLTLTAASEAIIVESSWVPAENEQACMRIHRIGQRRACRVRFATLADSIDEKINRAVMRKAADIATLFN